jgi:two-component system response regulator YesN
MKLLIVDDEPLARVGMRTIIPWRQKGFEIIGEASNVTDALKLARKTPPDLALVDIVMPEKNGFELIREIQKINAGCKFIVISCRSEVEFYQQAISLGVSEYIQKGTLETEELLNVVEKVRKQLEKERLIDDIITEAGNRQSRTFVPDFLNRVIRGEIEDGDLIASTLGSFELTSPGKFFFIIVIGNSDVPDIDETGTVDSDSSIANLCQEIIQESGSGSVFKSHENRLAAIYCPADDQEPGIMAREVCRRMRLTLQQLFDIDATFGISPTHSEPGELVSAYEEAKRALEQAFFDSRPGIYPFRNQEQADSGLPREVEQIKEAILDTRALGDTAGLTHLVDKITQSIRKSGPASSIKAIRGLYLDVIYHIIELLRIEKIPLNRVWTENRTPAEVVGAAENLGKIQHCIKDLLKRIGRYSWEREADRHSHAVEMIKKYVADHIYGKISLNNVSRYVALSPNYVCRLFKRETGETVIAYAQRIKVETAKSLLLQSWRLTEVAEKLCFTSESYFIKVFKKYTGMTTSEFNRQYQDDGNGSS